MFLDRLRLGKSVHASIRPIPDPQSSSWASESTLFWPSASPEASFVYIPTAETHYLCCCCVVFACHAGLVMSFQLRTLGHLRSSYSAGWRRVMTKKSDSAQSRSFRCCKRTVFKSTGRQVVIVCIKRKSVTFWYQHDKIRPHTTRKRNQSWVRHGKIKMFLYARRHAARTSLDGEWTTCSSQLKN